MEDDAVRPILSKHMSSEPARAEADDTGVEQGGDEEECIECERGGEFESVHPRYKRGPSEPTQKEIDEHEPLHIPFRSWCPECVAGGAKATPHVKATGDEEKSVPCIHLDYWFMREDRGGESVPVIVIKDDDTKAYGAHVVTVKGSVDWVAEKVCEDVQSFGHFGKI